MRTFRSYSYLKNQYQLVKLMIKRLIPDAALVLRYPSSELPAGACFPISTVGVYSEIEL